MSDCYCMPGKCDCGTMAGIDWGSVFSAIPSAATAAGLAVAIAPIAGSVPATVNRGSYWEIIFNEAQQERISAWILRQLNREPGPVRMDLGPIAWTVVARKYWPYVAGAVALGAVLGAGVARR